MEKEQAIKFAKEERKKYNCDGFVIIKNSISTINKWRALGFDATYDYILFADYEQLKNFIIGKMSFDFLDYSCIYCPDNGEKVVYAYSNSHIIIL